MAIESLYTDDMTPWFDLYAHDERMRVHLRMINSLFKKFHVRKFLDISCGTGNYTIPLNKMGYRGAGVDVEPAMIREAQRKCRIEGVEIPFFVQDMRNLRVKGKYDAIILPFTGFSYVKSSAHAITTLKRFRRHMKKGGVLLLDTVYSKKMPRKKIEVDRVRRGRMTYELVNEYYTDKNNDFMFVKCTHRRYISGRQLRAVRDKDFVKLRMYTPDTIKKILAKTGFKSIYFYGSYDRKKFSKASTRLITIAQAV